VEIGLKRLEIEAIKKNWLAIVYSGLASAKVIFVTIGLVSVLILSIFIVARKLNSRLLKGKTA